MGKVDLAPLDERAAVVNADLHTAAVLQISHQGQGSQRQRRAGRGQILLIVDLPVEVRLPLKPGPYHEATPVIDERDGGGGATNRRHWRARMQQRASRQRHGETHGAQPAPPAVTIPAHNNHRRRLYGVGGPAGKAC